MTRSLISGRRSATVAFATTAFKRLLLASALKERRGAAFAVPSPCFRTHPFLAFGSKRSFRDTASASSGEKLRIRGQRARTFAGQMGSDDDGETSGADFDLAQDPSELFDVYPPPPSPSHRNAIVTPEWGASYFPSPGPTGRTKERGRVHADGDWHRSVQAWIVQADAEGGGRVRVLLQRRSPYKDTHPNQLDVSCAGHVDAGEKTLDTMVRELEEELGGNGAMRERFTNDDVERARAFTVASSVEGVTEKFGRFICQEYQDVFVLWWKDSAPMDEKMFAPLIREEVSGFEVVGGRELIGRMRQKDAELVPRCMEYVDALAKAIGCD